MGKLTRAGYAALDALIEERGHEWLHGQLMNRIVEGERPLDVAAAFGVPWVVLRGWIEEHCPDEIALAERARADDLEWLATNAVDNADPDAVPLAKLKADHYMKVAGKLNRGKWGDKDVVSAGGFGGITIVIGRVKPAADFPVVEGESKVVIDGDVEVLEIEDSEVVGGEVV